MLFLYIDLFSRQYQFVSHKLLLILELFQEMSLVRLFHHLAIHVSEYFLLRLQESFLKNGLCSFVALNSGYTLFLRRFELAYRH